MRVAALYDVHGNLPALEAVLADPRCSEADVVVSGGDLCAGPMPLETLELLRRRRAVFVRGNADRELTGWPAERLTPARRAELRAWPLTATIAVGGLGDVLFCHASPRRDDEILTRATPDPVVAEACAGAALVVCGHTHVQYDRVVGATRVVNAGSVGAPYEGRAAAFWALLGPEVQLVSTEYDVDAAVASIRATGYDNADELAQILLSPYGSDEATEELEARRRGA
ncbi:MAG TPA: metallophosphoesterase family protein [Gaiellaceae bacterium]|nr:metallophosphoesterase family protein [Gaiellaceae bacterium]